MNHSLKKGANNTYFGNIKEGIRTSLKGLSLTWKHLIEARQSRKPIFVDNPDYFKQQTGIVTLQYPHQHLPLPDNGRYQLHNEMDDCIVCDKCAKVCPVDCIEIEPIKSAGIAGYASDGSAIRLFAAKFDIDMAKCMFCGLCTTVCPTECLTMTSEYDFSTFDITTHNFEFGNLTPEQSQEKRQLYEQFVAEKETMKIINREQRIDNSEKIEEAPKLKPLFRPSFRKAETESPVIDEVEVEETLKSKPAFKPSFKPKVTDSQEIMAKVEDVIPEISKPKPVFKPSFKPKPVENKEIIEEKVVEEKVEEALKPKSVFKPSFKTKPVENKEIIEEKVVEEKVEEIPKPKPVFKPSFKPKPVTSEQLSINNEQLIKEVPTPKPVFKPSFKKPNVDNKE